MSLSNFSRDQRKAAVLNLVLNQQHSVEVFLNVPGFPRPPLAVVGASNRIRLPELPTILPSYRRERENEKERTRERERVKGSGRYPPHFGALCLPLRTRG